MSDLVRFGVAMERELLNEFDGRIAARGYENRSEALRDLVRADLTRAAWTSGEPVVGSLTIVCLRKNLADVTRVVESAAAGGRPEPEPVPSTISGASILLRTSVHIDGTRSLETVILRGRARDLQALAGQVAGMRGVYASELSIACTLGSIPRLPPAASEP